jgi:VIT1/CCC1 family predicted Fe2+/Mn2+ transporter
MLKRKTANIVLDAAQHSWKKRPSEIRGYQRAFYITSEDGDYIRVDYSIKEKRVRLYIEIDAEGGNAYYSVITNGKITAERSVSTGRSYGFSEKFRERADVFSTLPNNAILKLINRNYGIQRATAAAEKEKEKRRPVTEKEKLLRETKRRYFKREFYDAEGEEGAGRGRLFKNIGLIDLVDFMIGLLLSALVFVYFRYSYVAMGVTAAFFGIIIGFVDIFFRERSPVFAKVLFFLVAGALSYIYGYFF